MIFGPYEEDDLLDLVDDWHKGRSGQSLHEFLGWTQEQYAHWVETSEQPT